MKRFNIFPSLVYLVDCDELIDDVKSACENYDWNDTLSNEGSNLSSKKNILEQEYINLVKLFEDKVNLTLDEIGYDNKFQLTNSWFTKTEPSSQIIRHNHNNSLWSSVFYFDDNCGHLTFYKNSPAIYIVPDNANPDLLMYGAVHFPCVKGKMLLFPSELDHAVMNNNSNRVRHSLAMNFMPRGLCGFGDSSYFYTNANDSTN